VNVLYSADYVRAGYAFDTTRKAAWIAESLSTRPLATVDVLRPEPVRAAQLGDVHQPTYVESIRTGEPRDLAESQGFTWDPQLWPSVCASTGGVTRPSSNTRVRWAAERLTSHRTPHPE
jgi:hypothetical protein